MRSFERGPLGAGPSLVRARALGHDLTRRTAPPSPPPGPILQRLSLQGFELRVRAEGAQQGERSRARSDAWYDDFVAYFEADYLATERAGGFLEDGVMYNWDWRQYVQDPAFGLDELNSHLETFAPLRREHRRQLLTPKKVARPGRIGRELELTSIVLGLKKESAYEAIENGWVLAETRAKELDWPVLRLETEGVKRGTPIIELVTGPLLPKEDKAKAFLDARAQLFQALGKKRALRLALDEYNKSLRKDQVRYRLVPTAYAGELNVTKGSSKINVNPQANVAIPYSLIGQAGDEKDKRDFSFMFQDPSDRKIYNAARTGANAIAAQLSQGVDLRNVISLLTHLIHYRAKITYHRLEDRDPELVKHAFHTLFKFSPEDAVLTILSDAEIGALVQWTAAGGWLELVVDKINKALAATGTQLRETKGNAEDDLINVLLTAVSLRERSRRQRLETVEGHGPSRVFGSRDLSDQEIRHTHPRPSNRIPIYSSGNEHYVVVEQRHPKHPLNQ